MSETITPVTMLLDDAALSVGLRLSMAARASDIQLPDAAVASIDDLVAAVEKWTGEKVDRRPLSDQTFTQTIFGMRILVDATVPPGYIEFRPALRLPL